MAKRDRLEVIYDILNIVKENTRPIKKTPLLRKSNLSSSRFTEYFLYLIENEFIKEEKDKDNILIIITTKGEKYLEKYRGIIHFIDEFGL